MKPGCGRMGTNDGWMTLDPGVNPVDPIDPDEAEAAETAPRAPRGRKASAAVKAASESAHDPRPSGHAPVRGPVAGQHMGRNTRPGRV